MALNRAQLKALWITGYEPTQQDFSDFFDSFLNNQDESKDGNNGYVGLTLFAINFKNALNTFTSFFTNANTAARTYTFQDKDGTIADIADIAAIGTNWINTFVPVISSTSGTITTKSARCSYTIVGKFCFIEIQIIITTNGTGAGSLLATLPFLSATLAGSGWSLMGAEKTNTGHTCNGIILSNVQNVLINKYDGTYPGANGNTIYLSGVYKIA